MEKVAADLEDDLAHFGGIQQIRWVASQQRALNALKKNYEATCLHLQNIASLENTDAAKARGLLLRLKSPKFLRFLMFMIDFTEAIGFVSLSFQADDLLVIDVLPLLEIAVTGLVEMKTTPGKCVSSLTKGHKYGNITLSGEVKPELDDLHKNMLDSAIQHIDQRFSGLQKPPLSDFRVLNYTLWPYDVEDLTAFGKENVLRLVKQFAPLLSDEEIEAIPREWQNFKLHVRNLRTSQPKVVYRDLLIGQPKNMIHFLPLVEIMLTISMSTAIVERGFSHMNNIKDSTRTVLGNDTLNNLLEIKINGPSVADFSPEESILHWYDSTTGTRHVNGHRQWK